MVKHLKKKTELVINVIIPSYNCQHLGPSIVLDGENFHTNNSMPNFCSKTLCLNSAAELDPLHDIINPHFLIWMIETCHKCLRHDGIHNFYIFITMEITRKVKIPPFSWKIIGCLNFWLSYRAHRHSKRKPIFFLYRSMNLKNQLINL